jgi:hypothetical protein
LGARQFAISGASGFDDRRFRIGLGAGEIRVLAAVLTVL